MGRLHKSSFSTHRLPQAQCLDAWRDSISAVFDITPDRRAENERFDSRVDSYLIDDQLMLGRCDTFGQRFERSSLRTARDGLDHYLVQTHLTGSQKMMRGSREVECKAGDLMVIDLADRHDAVTDDFTQLTLVVPRPLLAPLLKEPDSQEARVLSAGSALTDLAVNHLKTLYSVLGTLSGNDAPQVIQPTLQLIASALNGSAADVENGTAGVALHLFAQARVEIERNLHRNLTADTVCAALNMSRSTLYRLFEPFGGVRAYIQERRLRRSTEALLSDTASGMRICDIAYAWGFASEAHYSRAFRQRYGMSPRDARATKAALETLASPMESLLVGDKDYERWLVNLRL